MCWQCLWPKRFALSNSHDAVIVPVPNYNVTLNQIRSKILLAYFKPKLGTANNYIAN